MKSSRFSRLRAILATADPLPALTVGYLIGLLVAWSACCMNRIEFGIPLRALPFFSAMNAMIACELPIALCVFLAGLARFPRLCQLPILYRSLLWSYGSVRVYLSADQGFAYFRYVIAGGATLFSLCCLARLSADFAKRPLSPAKDRTVAYLAGCLFYFGLILLTLPLRG